MLYMTVPSERSVGVTEKSGGGRHERKFKTMDANEAVANVAYHLNEIIAIYPITPSSPMGELADQWSSEGVPNIWGTVPHVIEMQSEGGAAVAVHGALQPVPLATHLHCVTGFAADGPQHE